MARICVVGSLNMDLVVQSPRLPRPGETLLGGPLVTFPGGKGANQAVAAARLGAAVTMVGAVADDSFGASLKRQLEADGVGLLLDIEKERTGVALITTEPSGENTIVVAPGANAALDPAFVKAAAATLMAVDFVVLGLEVRFEAVQAAAKAARAGKARVLLNAAPARPLSDDFLSSIDVLVVNQHEAVALSGGKQDATPDVLLRKLRARGPKLVVITLGAKGAVAMEGQEILTQPAFKVEAIDAVAAGDAFVGAFTVALAEGRDLAAALRFACAAGALATTRRGAQPSLPRRPEVDALLAGRS
jgi:ribokinase